jgi:U3 small nucleolar RNA-associated protein 23
VAVLQVLIDGTFCRAALNGKINIGEQMPKYLDAEVKLCTTACVMAECRALGLYLFPQKLALIGIS